MPDDGHELRELLHHAAGSFKPLDGAAVRAAADHRGGGPTRRFALPAAVAASVAGIALIGVLIANHNSPSHDSAVATAPPESITSSNGHPSTTADHAFQVKLILGSASFPADGQPIHGYVLAINHTGRPVVIQNACNGWVQAGLTGGNATFGISNGAVACASKTLKQGTTRVPVIIPTTFTDCQQGKQQGNAHDPHCLDPHDSRFPNLPAGTYRAVVKTQSTSISPVLPKPRPITLTATR